MNYCKCQNLKTLDTGSGNILLLRGYKHEDIFSSYADVLCLSCGKEQLEDVREEREAKVINIMGINFPIYMLMFEYSYIRRILMEQGKEVSIQALRNIMEFIFFLYNGAYYEYFCNYIFRDLRNALVDYAINNNTCWDTERFDCKAIIYDFLAYLSEYSSEAFEMEKVILSMKRAKDSEKLKIKYGPVSIGIAYVDGYKIVSSLNEMYLKKKKYERDGSVIIRQINENMQLIYDGILQCIKKGYNGNFDEVWQGYLNDSGDVKSSIIKFIETELRFSGNHVFLMGVKQVFGNILYYSVPEISYFNYTDVLFKTIEMARIVLQYVS